MTSFCTCQQMGQRRNVRFTIVTLKVLLDVNDSRGMVRGGTPASQSFENAVSSPQSESSASVVVSALLFADLIVWDWTWDSGVHIISY